ncbi:hypothetical protein DFQ28_000160 [Apophysomyces sp. BC1034]|nr:hypothetical protein DFQ30_002207 [Apophysomyces sp. BC1015]KAG0179686.1 hypothetical protein DFQ29_001758 [Apophysomyces sp. BC1021]KAG0191443.1 hypothetical protein DFQ28_000160 [Apophysomyces sp. BC1034]
MARLVFVSFLALLLVSVASAHFQLTYPTSRGFNEDQEPTAPCGGFDSVQPRTQFPLQNGFVEIAAHHPQYTYQVNVLINNQPTTADFVAANLKQIAMGQRNYPMAACLPVNFANVTDAKNGVNATIQVLFNGGDGQLYQCTDVVLVDQAANFNASQCVNADGSSPTSGNGSSNQPKNSVGSLSVASGLLFTAVAISGSLLL